MLRKCLFCLPDSAFASTSLDPLLLNEDYNVRETEIHQLCKSLRSRIETQNCQAQVYFCQAREHRMRAELCAQNTDRVGVRQFLIEERKALKEQELELKQMSNLSTICTRLERALRDLETGRHLGRATLTLNELLEKMPDLEEVMADLEDTMHRVNDNSSTLSRSLASADVNEMVESEMLDSEVDALMGPLLPSVPSAQGKPRAEGNARAESVDDLLSRRRTVNGNSNQQVPS